MESGLGRETRDKGESQTGPKQGASVLPRIEPFVPKRDHNPRELMSWAKRTGFVSNFSGEIGTGVIEKNDSDTFDLERANGSGSPKIEIDPVLGRTKNRISEIVPDLGSDGAGRNEKQRNRIEVEAFLGEKNEEKETQLNGNGNGIGSNGHGGTTSEANGTRVIQQKKDDRNVDSEIGIDLFSDGEETDKRDPNQSMKCGLKENPGFVPLIYYGVQHYLSLAGSLIFVPLVIVPAMGGTDNDTASVISTVLLISGITTILHSFFGTRLPLVQGSSFVYLAPALVIINSRDFRDLTEHKFRHIMRELQGAIIIGSIFQTLLGFTGLMSFFLRLINPIVVAPTVAAIGLSFFSYGFPQAGSCIEISVPQILLLLIFTLYLQGVSVFGHRLFRIYAVPLSVVIIWAYAFFLTAGGAYDYKGCRTGIPSSNILSDSCRKHAYTMQHCRTDVSNAWRSATWIRIPYPLQWGIPIFKLRTSIIMVVVSIVATVESVGTYHSASIKINSRPPTPGIVSRGIGLEGICSLLAGLWGTGTGSTTLTENVNTIDVTKVASQRALQIGAGILILFSFVGKVGAVLASIPQALAAAVLCFIWSLITTLGLSTLRNSGSFRNITIVGVSLFLGLSVPVYFQQYQPNSSLILPGYYLAYSAASNGPVQTGSKQVDFAINGLLSLNMVVTLIVAFVLDNTVPGTHQERGVYVWSKSKSNHNDPTTMDQSSISNYSLPDKISRFFRCTKSFGA